MPLVASPAPDAYVRALIDVVREATDSAGLTQEQVGDLLGGLSQQTVSRLWAYKRSIDAQELFSLAGALNVEASSLVAAAQQRVTDSAAVDLERKASLQRRERVLRHLAAERRRRRAAAADAQQAG